MFYENFSRNKCSDYKTINYKYFNKFDVSKSDNVMDYNDTPLTYNYEFSNGVLTDGIGFRDLNFKCYADDDMYKKLDGLPGGYYPTRCWHFSIWANELKTYRSLFFVLGSDGYVYYNWLHTNITEFTKIDGLCFTSDPYVFASKIDNDDVLIFISKNDGSYIWSYPNIVKKIDHMPVVSSVCAFDNRYFATINGNRGSIIYTNDLNPINLNLDLLQGNKIILDDYSGECNKVIVFKGNLYIFRDFDIVELSKYSNRYDYDLSKIYTSNGRIFSKSICVCGDVVIYLASDGVYSFDGNKVKRINLSIDNSFKGIDNYNAVASCINGDYYLSCKLNYYDDNNVVDGEWANGNNRNNALIKLNLESGNLSIFRGYDIVGLYEVNDIYRGEMCALVRQVGGTYRLGVLDMSGKYFDKVLTKLWKTPITDFGYSDKMKVIKDISFETKRDIDLKIFVDSKIKVIKVKGNVLPQTIKINRKCRKFGFAFVSKEIGNYITSPKIKVGIL